MNPMSEILKKRDNIVSRKVAGDSLLIPIRGRLADMQRIFAVDSVGEFVWDHIDGRNTLAQILDAVAEEFEVDRATAREDLLAFIKSLRRTELLESPP